MTDFSQDINNFQNNGVYTYFFDNVGNMVFNPSSSNFNQVYVAFPLVNIKYSPSKIQSLYNPDFTEFIPTPTISESIFTSTTESISNLEAQLSASQVQNAALQDQLNLVIAENETSGSAATQQAIQQVIIELRIELGQGRVASDFSTDFPYTPIIKTTS